MKPKAAGIMLTFIAAMGLIGCHKGSTGNAGGGENTAENTSAATMAPAGGAENATGSGGASNTAGPASTVNENAVESLEAENAARETTTSGGGAENATGSTAGSDNTPAGNGASAGGNAD